MTAYEQTRVKLQANPKKWLVTGVAGFIGSNLLECLLKLNQMVVGLDNFSTGHQRNLDEVESQVSPDQWARFHFIEGDIRSLADCQRACDNVDLVLHQAALGSVPRSINDPITTNDANISGFLNMLVATRDAGAGRFVYAASSSTYGDHPGLPKVEDTIGKPLSPYAVTKVANELYADVFAKTYDMEIIGLRYFNVFGQRQDPKGAYAAVIPKWFDALIRGDDVFINGDGETSRDFCYIDNCLQANILAALTENPKALSQVYNVAVGERTTLNVLFSQIRSIVCRENPELSDIRPVYRDFRPGDVRHSLADIGKAESLLGYQPEFMVNEGLEQAARWYLKNSASNGSNKEQDKYAHAQ